MRVLFAVNEATPIYKLGGLGDVGGSLPIALNLLDIDIRIVLPLHPEIALSQINATLLESFSCIYNRVRLNISVYQGFLTGSRVPIYYLAEPRYLTSPSGPQDNYADKYAVFSLAIAHWLHETKMSWQPQLIHLNDWHTALVPVIMRHLYSVRHIRFLITIHNLAYQGITEMPVARRLNLPQHVCQIMSWDESDGDTNILLEGILHSDIITTVSPTYAQEILTSRFGEQLHEILNQKSAHIVGIVNGLDQQFFNPQTDVFIARKYDSQNAAILKTENKIDLQKFLNLPVNPSSPLISYIGRLDPRQKGIDIIDNLLQSQALISEDSQFVFLGTGDPDWERKLHNYDSNPHIRIITRFDESLAHRLYASSDLLFIPSNFEPCGLIQMIAMRYGSLPVAHAVGGLKDTIRHNQTGFLYEPNTSTSASECLTQAKNMINNPEVRQRLIQNAMAVDSSWLLSAKQYATLYQNLVG